MPDPAGPQVRRPRRAPRRLAAVAAIAALLVAPATGASADEAVDGLWYFDALHIQNAHDAGWTGAGVKVAVIDTALNPDAPALADAEITVAPTTLCAEAGDVDAGATTGAELDPHGTAVASIIVGNGSGFDGPGTRGVAPDAELLFYSFGSRGGERLCPGGGDSAKAMALGIQHAVDDGADIITISLGVQFNASEDALVNAYAAGVPVLYALPNSGSDGGNYRNLNGVIRVESVDSDGSLAESAWANGRFGQRTVLSPGRDLLLPSSDASGWHDSPIDGTSFATPLAAGLLAVVKQKYPEATGNQLIQALIRTTGGTEHEPDFDNDYGYGVVSLTGMLAADPTAYPDENPLLTDVSPFDGSPMTPTTERLLAARAAAEGVGVEASPAPPIADEEATPDASGPPWWLFVAIGVPIGLLVLGALVAVVVLVAVRRRRPAPPAGT